VRRPTVVSSACPSRSHDLHGRAVLALEIERVEPERNPQIVGARPSEAFRHHPHDGGDLGSDA